MPSRKSRATTRTSRATTRKSRTTTKTTKAVKKVTRTSKAKPKAKATKLKAKAAKTPSAAPVVAAGKIAPAFVLDSGSGERIALKDFRGKLVALYFYPKDMTPGCTIEACDFSDRLPEIEQAGAVVLGVSPDSRESHIKFTAKHGLRFPLLADVGAAVAKKYGVWQEKALYGRKFMGNVRTTFLIDREGRVARVWRNVKVNGHADDVLASVRELAALPV